MDELYEKIERLCAEKKVSMTAMCREAKVPRSALSDYKAGRIKSISADKLTKIAGYFGISVDYLLGHTAAQNTSAQPDKRNITEDDLKLALFGGDSEVTDQMWDEATFAIQLIKERHKRKKDNNG